MDHQYRCQLPRSLQDLVDEIEAHANRPIHIGIRTDGGPACRLNETFAQIVFPDPNSIDIDAMRHELLHIQRNWVQQVPLLFSNTGDPTIEQTVADIDNVLEHPIVVPSEAFYGAINPYARWNGLSADWWGNQRWLTSPQERWRTNFLLRWLTVAFIVTELSTRRLAKETLHRENLLGEAIAFADHIALALNSKPQVAAIAAYYLGIPLAYVELRTYDVVIGAIKRQPVPVWQP